MVAEEFQRDPLVRQWLDGVEPTSVLMKLDSLCAPGQPPSPGHTAINFALDSAAEEIDRSPVTRSRFNELRERDHAWAQADRMS